MRWLRDFQEILQLTGILPSKLKYSVAFSYMEKSVKTKLASFGISLEGSRDSDIQVLSPDFYENFHEQKFLFGLEAGYVAGIWTATDLRACLRNLLSAEMLFGAVNQKSGSFKTWLKKIASKVFAWADEKIERTQENEIDPAIYQIILDPYMNLGSGHWETEGSLNSAQTDKMNLVASKLKLKPGMTVLVIGSGFGGLCNYFAFNYEVTVVGVTHSESQVAYARQYSSSSKVCYKLMEYDCLFFTQKFDCIFSTEQLQVPDHKKYFATVVKYLKDDGLFLFETPGTQNYDSLQWLTNSVNVPNPIISLESLHDVFLVEDIENFGEHFYKTFEGWNDKLDKNSSHLSNSYGENAVRKLKFYYACNSEGFRIGKFQWWQLLLSKKHKDDVDRACSFSELFDEDL